MFNMLINGNQKLIHLIYKISLFCLGKSKINFQRKINIKNPSNILVAH
jgi:hypothetical protein